MLNISKNSFPRLLPLSLSMLVLANKVILVIPSGRASELRAQLGRNTPGTYRPDGNLGFKDVEQKVLALARTTRSGYYIRNRELVGDFMSSSGGNLSLLHPGARTEPVLPLVCMRSNVLCV